MDCQFDKLIKVKSRKDVIEVFPLGDLHIGKRNCAEREIQRAVKYIADTPNAWWIGGGDYLECVKPQDIKRHDPNSMADWMLKGTPEDIRHRLGDVVGQQIKRFTHIVKPIKDKCLGLIEGNHESSIRKHYNENVMDHLCERLEARNLTDQAIMRLRIQRTELSVRSVIIYIWHGWQGGRTDGAEPTHLGKMFRQYDADIYFRGHSHTFHILPPQVQLGISRSGELGKETTAIYRHAANWGCWLYSGMSGPPSYESQQGYPPRPLMSVKAVVTPFAPDGRNKEKMRIVMQEVRM